MSESQANGANGFDGKPHDLEATTSRKEVVPTQPISEDAKPLNHLHVRAIAIATILGTGFFLGAGREVIEVAGPLGSLIVYLVVGSIAYSVICSVGEMASHAPLTGSFPRYAAMYVDDALGFAVGWNYFFSAAMAIPAEIAAADLTLEFWDPKKAHIAGYNTLICVCVTVVSLIPLRWFANLEVGFTAIKLLLVIGLILFGIIVDAGGSPDHDSIGFRYWNHPGPFRSATDLTGNVGFGRFLAVWTVFIQVGFTFQGMELVAIAASDTKNVRDGIGRSIHIVFFTILTLYILGIFVAGMLIPYNVQIPPEDTRGPGASPFILAMRTAMIHALPSVVNAGIFTSALSACCAFIYGGSRILYDLARLKQAPSILLKSWDNGKTPHVCIFVTCLFTLLSYLIVKPGTSSQIVFDRMSTLSSVAGYFTWWSINVTFLYFYRAKISRGLSRQDTGYFSRLQPYLSYWGVGWTTVLIITNGFRIFFNFNGSDFVTAYIDIPLFILAYLFWKIFKKTEFVDPKKVDFDAGNPTGIANMTQKGQEAIAITLRP